ncbi:MAG: hypothetical protein EOP88_00410 [Verrucomicrobiaceae bacterium]|nr:MAG: hypothetical protein EOP88_00410 [Verrucomicrobiaceae bacterium]
MKIETEYLGLKLRSPLVVASSPLTWKTNNFRHLEDAGASAIVLHSLFEMRSEARRANYQFGCLVGADAYVQQIQQAKQLVRVPIIASISCTTPERWGDFAALVESAGADALEINVHTAPAELDTSGSEGEERWFEIIAAVRAATTIPLSVKLIPYLTWITGSPSTGLVSFIRKLPLISPQVEEFMRRRTSSSCLWPERGSPCLAAS